MNGERQRAAERRRPYRMQSRATAAAATAEKILQATIELHTERFHDQVALDDIAERAGVTVQTVLRRFGSKDALISAAAEVAVEEVRRQRSLAPVGDVRGAVDNVLDHYEQWGATALRLLAQEERVPQLAAIADVGRRAHYEWVERTFAPFLERARDRALLRAKLITLTDVFTWRLLHRDLGLERAQTASVLVDLIDASVREGGTA